MALFDPGEFPSEVPTPTVEAPSLDFTVADVLAWARTKPADEEYDYCQAGHCALAQFIIETRGAEPRAFGWCDGDQYRSYEPRLLEAAQDTVSDLSEAERWNFGALVKRLEAL